MNLLKSKEAFERAKKVIPGGVNSPVRAFKSVEGHPPFIKEGKGAYIWDIDNNQYIDYVGSWGPLILGHAHEAVMQRITEVLQKGSSFGAPTEQETILAEMITERVPSVEMVRLVNSGTEATMSAIRLARGVTGRDKIIKFDGCYHGHADSFLISAGSGAVTFGEPNSPGVTKATAKDTLIADFNNIESVEKIFDNNKNQIAAIIVEPIVGNSGCIPPRNNFLQELKNLCKKNDTLLILDEVMTGFRVDYGGCNSRYNIDADIITMGKVIGGGLPIGAYGGKKIYMEQISPSGNIYQAGTLSGNPLAVASGIATLENLTKESYNLLEKKGKFLEEAIQNIIDKNDYPLFQNRVGSMFSLFFTKGEVKTAKDVASCDFKKFNQYFHNLLENGIYIAPSQYEAGFISLAHSQEDLETTVEKIENSLKKVFS